MLLFWGEVGLFGPGVKTWESANPKTVILIRNDSTGKETETQSYGPALYPHGSIRILEVGTAGPDRFTYSQPGQAAGASYGTEWKFGEVLKCPMIYLLRMALDKSDRSQCPPAGEETPGRRDSHAAPQARSRATAGELAADLELAVAALAGDRGAERQFLERMRCIPRILAARSRNLPLPRTELADLAQDVFATVWRKLGDYRGEAPLEAWVHAFCVRMLGSAVRKRDREPRMAIGENLQDLTPRRQDRANGDLDRLRMAIERLDEDHKKVVRLHGIEGLTYAEIAIRISSSERAARARYQRGIAHLRVLLNEANVQSKEA